MEDTFYHRCVCLRCGGVGRLPNGKLTIQEEGLIEHEQGDLCDVCEGKGLINVSAVPDEVKK